MPLPGRLARTAAAVLALPVAAACSSSTDGGASFSSRPESPSVTGIPTAPDSAVANIRITIAGQPIQARLADNPTARELVGRLPVTLAFHDLNDLEKIAALPEPLTTEGVPDGDDPEIGDIGHYALSQDLVLYYGDVGYWNGIVRIDHFDRDQLALIQDQPDGFAVTIENA